MQTFWNIDVSWHATAFIYPAVCCRRHGALLPGSYSCYFRAAIEAQSWIGRDHGANTARLLERERADLGVNFASDIKQEGPEPHHLRLQRGMVLQPPLELLVGGSELLDLLLQEGRVRLLLLPVLAHGLPVPQRLPWPGRVLLLPPGVVGGGRAAGEDLGVRVEARVGVHGRRRAGRVAAVRVGAGRCGGVEELVEAVGHLRVGEEQLAGEVSSIVHCDRECAKNNFAPPVVNGQVAGARDAQKKEREKDEGIKKLVLRGCCLRL